MEAKAMMLLYINFILHFTHIIGEGDIPLIKLIKLHTEHCSSPTFCTFKSDTGESPLQNTTCCQKCSCETDCTTLGTCCPDYRLTEIIGTEVSSDVSHLSKRLQNVSFTSETQDHMECMEVRNGRDSKDRVALNVVARCSANFQDTMNISKKCEETSDISSIQSDQIIPITSTRSLITYKNKYCMLCNGETALRNTREWRPFLSCRGERHFNFIEVTPLDFLKTLLKTENGLQKCHVEFWLDSYFLEKLDKSKCEVVDFATCPERSDKVLDHLCRSFQLTVSYPVNEVIAKRYKNIACYLCRSDKPFLHGCMINKTEGHEYKLNILVNRNNNPSDTDNTEKPASLDVKVERYGCNFGFTRITRNGKSVCTRVLCPLNFYPTDGQCTPSIAVVEGVYYVAILDVRRPSKVNSEILDKIRKTYINKMVVAARLLADLNIGIWEKDNIYDLVVISFLMRNENSNYKNTMNIFGAYLNDISMVTYTADYMAVRVSISLNRDPNVSWSSFSTVMPRLKQIRAMKEVDSTLTMIELFHTHLCYRVAVPISEKTFYTKNRLVEESLQYTRSGEIKVCVDDVYRNISHVNSAYMFAGISVKTTVELMKEMSKLENTEGDSSSKNDNNDNNNKDNKNGKNKFTDTSSKISEDDDIFDLENILLAIGLPITAIIVAAVAVAVLKKRREERENVHDTVVETSTKTNT